MTIHDSLKSSISHRPIARDLWESLKKRFSVSSGPKLQQLKAALAVCKQQGSTVESYYGRVNKIWDAILTIRHVRSCKCGKCDCKINDELENDHEEDKLQQFVLGLDDNYQTIRSSLLRRVPLPSVEEAYNAVRQEEDMIGGIKHQDDRVDVSALAVRLQPKYRDDKKKTVCIHCNRTGHASDQCFAKLGYPDWWGTRPRVRLPAPQSQPTRNVTANAARTTLTPTASAPITDQDKQALAGVSEDQWQLIFRLLKTNPLSSPNDHTGTYSSPWILDTGASHHMTGRLDLLSNLRTIDPVLVILADGTQRMASQEGCVRLGPHLVLKSVFLVKELETDLISLGQLLDENSCVVQLTDKLLLIQDRFSRMVIGLGRRFNGTFYFHGVEQAFASQTRKVEDYELWHSRFGHPSKKVLEAFSDFSFVSSSNKACDTCLRAKQSRDPFPLSNKIADQIFDLVHCDVWGPYRTPSSSGARFFLTIVDDKSRCVWLYLMREKSETQFRLKEFISLVERQFGKNVKTVRSDNGTEFMCLGRYFREQGIIHETSCVGTPNQNGRAERKHRHILNVARALRFHASLPIRFWGECILTAAYLINRTPSALLQNRTPHEVLYGTAPSSRHLRVFGSLCYAHNQSTRGDKFDSRSRRCILVGYPHGQKGWRLYDIERDQFFVSRDVKFFEEEFPFAENSALEHNNDGVFVNEPNTSVGSLICNGPNLSKPICLTSYDAGTSSTSSTPISEEINLTPTRDSLPPPMSLPAGSSSPAVPSPESESPPIDAVGDAAPIFEPVPIEVLDPAPVVAAPSDQVVSQRSRQLPAKLRDYILNNVTSESLIANSHSLSHVDSTIRFSEAHRIFQAAITLTSEPTSFTQANADPLWQEAMASEIAALELNNTWTITDLPPGKSAIGSQWVYKLKFHSDGELERRKARLVAQGNRQKEGQDYTETFAPVAKMCTVRVFLKCAAAQNWIVHQMDVHNAFLHGDLSEEVYMRLPQGFQVSSPHKVCRLNKSLYGLKQAPRCWFAKLSSALIDYGFVQSYADYSLFIYRRGSVNIRILIYVDDLIIAGNSESEVAVFKAYLSTTFHMKDLGLLKYFLGIEVARSSRGFFLCQRKYALELLADAGLLGSKPSVVPLPQHHHLATSTSAPIPDPTTYRRLVGKLIYLANTRPDLAYTVHILAQFMQHPLVDHWDAALKVLRYIKNAPGQGILLSSLPDLTLSGWCDSDWAACPVSRRSLTGYVVQLGDSSISWKTKKQLKVSRSSAEAEYRAMAFLTQELIWLKSLLHDFGVEQSASMKVFTDSKSAMELAANPVHHERTKHVGIDCHFIRDELVSGNIQTVYVPTQSQIADIFTKALGQRELQVHNCKLGIINLHAAPS